MVATGKRGTAAHQGGLDRHQLDPGLTANCSRNGKPLQAAHLACFIQRTSRCDTSLRSTPEALLQLVRERWSIERWHWIRDTQPHEEAHRYKGNGAGVMASLRTAALNLLR